MASSLSVDRRERRWIMLCAIAPDLDGATFWNRDLWETVHHTFGHNVFFAVAMGAIGGMIAPPARRLRFALWSVLSVLVLHYGLDLLISGTWPLRPFWPVSNFDANLAGLVDDRDRMDWWLRVPVQWTLVVIAIALAVRTWRRHGRSALELVSSRLDELLIGYLARTLRRETCIECGQRAGFQCASCHANFCGTHVRIRKLEACCADCVQTGSQVIPS